MVGQRPSASVQLLITCRLGLTVIKEGEIDRYPRGRERGGGGGGGGGWRKRSIGIERERERIEEFVCAVCVQGTEARLFQRQSWTKCEKRAGAHYYGQNKQTQKTSALVRFLDFNVPSAG